MCMERNTKYLRKLQSICDSSLEEEHADLQNTVYAGLREDTTRVCSGEVGRCILNRGATIRMTIDN